MQELDRDLQEQPHSRRLLTIPGMSAYLTGNTLDRLADGMLYVALAWVAARTGAVSVATVLAAGSLPRLVVLLLGGALGDRFGLARVATATLIGRGVLLAGFAWILMSPHPSGILLAVIAAGFGIIDAAHVPAMSGISALLVRGKELASAQGLLGAATEVMEVVAAPLTGYLLVWHSGLVAGVGVVLVVISLFCIASIRAAAARQTIPQDAPGEDDEVDDDDGRSGFRGLLDDVREGLRVNWTIPGMRLALGVSLVANLAATGPVLAGLPLKAVEQGWPASTYGWAATGLAAGGVLGLLALNRWSDRMTGPLLWAGWLLLVGSVGIGVLTVSTTPVGAVIGAGVIGLCFAPGARLVIAWVQSVSAPEMVGRTMSLVQLSIYAGTPLGYLLYGLLAVISVTMAGLVMSAALLLASLAIVAWCRAQAHAVTVTP